MQITTISNLTARTANQTTTISNKTITILTQTAAISNQTASIIILLPVSRTVKSGRYGLIKAVQNNSDTDEVKDKEKDR